MDFATLATCFSSPACLVTQATGGLDNIITVVGDLAPKLLLDRA